LVSRRTPRMYFVVDTYGQDQSKHRVRLLSL
jgi:hypothetical protein